MCEDKKKTLFEVGKTYKTRDGRDARVICVDARDEKEDEPILALVSKRGGKEIICGYANDGSFDGVGFDDRHDLMPPTRTVWVNFYYSDKCAEYYDTEEHARRMKAGSNRLATAIPVEIPDVQ
jgi:hypothetical protein